MVNKKYYVLDDTPWLIAEVETKGITQVSRETKIPRGSLVFAIRRVLSEEQISALPHERNRSKPYNQK